MGSGNPQENNNLNKENLRKLLLEAIQRENGVNEDDLITEEDREKKIVSREEMKPRRSCANCTCGKKEEKTVVKKSECGNCYKGDLFRCEGCPSFGLPPYKPGDTVSFNEDDL
ncbi:Fe-S cluster assembly protein DRE2 [Nosema granulosis]|uniref:Fe-S cluster assembly protein DRE2 n=1 Tax=Nosema granulosis TaxID=83296 RepID=A0A9P6KZ93_9MICR|nr:Fe-S cluster assembly protein DRE2 [Nosema granulosis]